MIGHIITTAVLVSDQRVYWAITIGCPAGLCLFSCVCQNNIRIVFTSLIGSYAVTRGIACYLGGFPNEIELQRQLETGFITWEKFPKSFYVYFLAFFCILVLSICF